MKGLGTTDFLHATSPAQPYSSAALALLRLVQPSPVQCAASTAAPTHNAEEDLGRAQQH